MRNNTSHRVSTIALTAGLVLAVGATLGLQPSAFAQGCGRHYVAAGDAIAAGKEVTESERYSRQLWEDHLKTWGAWCEYNIAKDKTTSTTYITGGQLAQTWNYRPDLITLTIGEQNNQIINLVDSCFDKIKSHDFSGGSACAGAILGNTTLWSGLNSNLITTFQQYRMIMAGRPWLVVAVTGYPNPYPKPLDAAAKIPELCTPLIDTIATCTIRWVQLPPALALLDQVFQKLNTTIANAVAPFANSTAGRFVFVNPYDKFRDHCMKMEVEMKTTVEHPEQQGAVHNHDNFTSVNFGCSDPWFVEGSDGTDNPWYLAPAAPGILINQSQTTKGMGVWPNADGHQCLGDLIWEADTIDPGTSPLKWKLGVPEPPKSDICQ